MATDGDVLSASDHHLVSDVLVRYASGIDGRDWELLRSCFTEDCDADYGDIGHWRSATEITDWMEAAHEPMGPTLHRITNVTAHRHGDTVSARCYVHAILPAGDDQAIHAFGSYVDVLVEGPGGFQIAERRFSSVAMELHPTL